LRFGLSIRLGFRRLRERETRGQNERERNGKYTHSFRLAFDCSRGDAHFVLAVLMLETGQRIKLKHQFQRKLDFPRITGTVDAAKWTRGAHSAAGQILIRHKGSIDTAELRVIEGVKELRAELEPR
jgi:hypothetical protein